MCNEFTNRNSDLKWRDIVVFSFWVVWNPAEALPSRVVHLFLPGCRHLIGLNVPTRYLCWLHCRYNLLIAHYINGTCNKSVKVLFVWFQPCKGLVCVRIRMFAEQEWLTNVQLVYREMFTFYIRFHPRVILYSVLGALDLFFSRSG